MRIKKIFKYLKKQKLKLLFLLLVILFSIVMQLMGVKIISVFIDSVLESATRESLMKLAVTYIIISVLKIVTSTFATYLSQKIGWASTNAIRSDLLKHCINLDLAFHKNKTSGKFLETIDGDVSNLFQLLSKMSVQLLSNGLLLILVLWSVFAENVYMGLGQALFAIIVVFALRYLKKKGVKIQKRDREFITSLMSFIGEIVSAADDLKGNSIKSYVQSRHEKMIKQWTPVRIKTNVYMWGNATVLLALQAVGYSICFGVGTFLWKNGHITVGTIYLFYNYTKYILDPLNAISIQFQNMHKSFASVDRIENLFSIKSELRYGFEEIELKVKNELKLSNVTFGYENKPVLNGISFSINSGECLGIVGKTGCGKSTKAKLISRLYEIDSGEIRFNGKNIYDIKLDDYLGRLVYITQDAELFSSSLRNNFTLFDDDITDDMIMNAITELGLMQWFKNIDDGLETIIGGSGTGLSAGEVQIISLVRGFFRNPEIVVLDEVTSKLDLETEKYINKALKKLMVNKIGIIIAHRLNTLKDTDYILHIDENGSIQEYYQTGDIVSDSSLNCLELFNSIS